MEAVEPIKIEIEGPGIDVDDSYDGCKVNGWGESYDYILHKVASEHFDLIDSSVYVDRMRDVLQDMLNPVSEVIGPENIFTADTMRYPVPDHFPIYVRDDMFLFPKSEVEGAFYIISNNNNEARSIRDNIINSIEETEETFSGAGVEAINYYTKSDFTQEMILSNSDITSITTDESDEFEQEVYETVEPISEAFTHNQIVDFGDHPQNREYDVLLALTPDDIFHISVKNYAGVDDQPSSEDVISDPRDIASLLGADMTISVVKGIEDEERMASFRREVELRNEIEICTETECISKVKEYIKNEMILSIYGDTGLSLLVT